MDSKPMDKQSEDLLVKAAKQVMSYVEADGEHPNDAIIKTAQNLGVDRNMLPLLVQTYNIGRTSYQQNHGGSSILDKQAEFPIARIETIMDRLYPSQPKSAAEVKRASAIDPCYFRPPDFTTPTAQAMTKVAEVKIRTIEEADPGEKIPLKIGEAFKTADQHKRACEVARRRYTTTRDNYLGAMGAITEYFKQASMFRLPFSEVQWNATRQWGSAAGHALNYAYKEAGLIEPTATGPPSLLRAVDYTAAPYTLIATAIKYAEALVQTAQEKAATESTAETQVKEAFRPFDPTPDESSSVTSPGSILLGGNNDPSWGTDKSANFLTNMAAVGLGSKLKSVGEGGPSTAEMVEDVTAQLNDPDHIGQLQQIQTRAMLSDMLQNDEVISGYDPEEVFDAYNELSQLSPRAAQQPMVVRPMLRRRLTQGAMEPFEAQQVADLEKAVSQTDVNTQTKVSEVLSASPILQ
jgi:hypothetical protein